MGSLSQGLDTNAVWFGKRFFHSPCQAVKIKPFNYSLYPVTGCSSGIGKSLASTIYHAGHRIVATARDVKSLSYLPDGPTVLKLHLDVTRQETITKAVADAVSKFHGIDVFINNAGYSLMGDMEGIAEADARHQLETNFWGPVHVTREALRVFREVNDPGRGGTVVQVSSMGGWITAPGHSFYHARYSRHPHFLTHNARTNKTKSVSSHWKASQNLSPRKSIQPGTSNFSSYPPAACAQISQAPVSNRHHDTLHTIIQTVPSAN